MSRPSTSRCGRRERSVPLRRCVRMKPGEHDRMAQIAQTALEAYASLSQSEQAGYGYLFLQAVAAGTPSVRASISEVCRGTGSTRKTVRRGLLGLEQAGTIVGIRHRSAEHGDEATEWVLRGGPHGATREADPYPPGGTAEPYPGGSNGYLPEGKWELPQYRHDDRCDDEDDGSHRLNLGNEAKRIADEVVSVYAAEGVAIPWDGALEAAQWAIEHDAISILRAKAITCSGQARTTAQSHPGKYLLTSCRNALWEVGKQAPSRDSADRPSDASKDDLDRVSEVDTAMRAFGGAEGEG